MLTIFTCKNRYIYLQGKYSHLVWCEMKLCQNLLMLYMYYNSLNPPLGTLYCTYTKLSFLSLYKCWLQSANEKSSYRSCDFFWFTSNASIGPTVQSVANNMERRRKFILVIKQLVIYSENYMYKCITIKKNLIILCLNYVYTKFEKFFF